MHLLCDELSRKYSCLRSDMTMATIDTCTCLGLSCLSSIDALERLVPQEFFKVDIRGLLLGRRDLSFIADAFFEYTSLIDALSR